MHDKENIFDSLVQSVPLGGRFFPILSIILKIIHWLILEAFPEAGQW